MLLLLLLRRRRRRRVVMVDVVRRWRWVVVVVVRQRRLGGWGRGWDLGEVLVVVHPHLEDAPGDADLGAEGVHGVGVGLVDAPPDAVRELAHAVLLLRRELGPETLLARRRGSGGRAPYGHLRVGRVRRRSGRVRGRGAAKLLARRLGQRGGRGRRGRRDVRRARVHVRRGQEQRHDTGGVGAGAGGGGHRRGRYRHRGSDAAGDRLASVEAAVAAAGGAGQRGGPVAPGRHELAAAVEHVRAKPRRVVPQALPVPPLGRLHHRPHGREAERRGRRCGRGATATAENAIPR